MHTFFSTLGKNIINSFAGKNIYIHLLAIGLTFLVAMSGLDGWYFSATRHPTLQLFLFPTVVIGGIVPIFLPIILAIIGNIKKNTTLMNTAYAVTQAAMLGWLISSSYKALTGRAHPDLRGDGLVSLDILSREFHFGFFERGIFWGWPSSHTTVAFSVAVALWVLFRKNNRIRYTAIILAAYIGIGISTNIHWLSDFVAGSLIGTVIGKEVGESFFERRKNSTILHK